MVSHDMAISGGNDWVETNMQLIKIITDFTNLDESTCGLIFRECQRFGNEYSSKGIWQCANKLATWVALCLIFICHAISFPPVKRVTNLYWTLGTITESFISAVTSISHIPFSSNLWSSSLLPHSQNFIFPITWLRKYQSLCNNSLNFQSTNPKPTCVYPPTCVLETMPLETLED